MTATFKVKIGLKRELMNDFFEFIEKPHSLRINLNSGKKIQTTKHGIKTQEKNGIESFCK